MIHLGWQVRHMGGMCVGPSPDPIPSFIKIGPPVKKLLIFSCCTTLCGGGVPGKPGTPTYRSSGRRRLLPGNQGAACDGELSRLPQRSRRVLLNGLEKSRMSPSRAGLEGARVAVAPVAILPESPIVGRRLFEEGA